MRPATVNAMAQKRDLAGREAVILDKMTELAQTLFSYDSAASHIDAHLRDIAWRRENAVLALDSATSFAQLLFARTWPVGRSGTQAPERGSAAVPTSPLVPAGRQGRRTPARTRQRCAVWLRNCPDDLLANKPRICSPGITFWSGFYFNAYFDANNSPGFLYVCCAGHVSRNSRNLDASPYHRNLPVGRHIDPIEWLATLSRRLSPAVRNSVLS